MGHALPHKTLDTLLVVVDGERRLPAASGDTDESIIEPICEEGVWILFREKLPDSSRVITPSLYGGGGRATGPNHEVHFNPLQGSHEVHVEIERDLAVRV